MILLILDQTNVLKIYILDFILKSSLLTLDFSVRRSVQYTVNILYITQKKIKIRETVNLSTDVDSIIIAMKRKNPKGWSIYLFIFWLKFFLDGLF